MTPHEMVLSPRSNAQAFCNEQWNRAAAVLRARPSLMTPHILLLVLKNRPPVHVVEFMLTTNPRAADIPLKGPTALLVAVQHNASVTVCRLLLEACPLALVALYSGYDPLHYAKIWRSEESELLELLNKPHSYWMNQSPSSAALLSSSSRPTLSPGQVELSSIESPPTPKSKTVRRTISPAERNAAAKDEEFDNIKTITRTIVRTQRRQGQALQVHKHHVETSLQEFQTWNVQERTTQLLDLEQRQEQHFRTQLIALEMKEKAMIARVKNMERRVNKTLELSKQVRAVRERRQDVTLQRLQASVDSCCAVTNRLDTIMEKRIERVELKMEQECLVNDYFRSDTRLQLDQMDFRAHAAAAATSANDEMTPIVYATPYIKEEDDSEDEELDYSIVPLCPKPFGGRQARSRRYPGRKKRRHRGLIHF
jgi:hypothetical protein